jgi:hypothetical protein
LIDSTTTASVEATVDVLSAILDCAASAAPRFTPRCDMLDYNAAHTVIIIDEKSLTQFRQMLQSVTVLLQDKNTNNRDFTVSEHWKYECFDFGSAHNASNNTTPVVGKRQEESDYRQDIHAMMSSPNNDVIHDGNSEKVVNGKLHTRLEALSVNVDSGMYDDDMLLTTTNAKHAHPVY